MATLTPDHPYASVQPPESSNGSVTGQVGSQQPGAHKRVYQACIPCRRRKVKCDLGSVDNPSDPPCVRCRRESKECYFSATRRKRKLPGEGSGSDVDNDYVVRNGRKRLQSSDSGSEPPPASRQQSGAGIARPMSSTYGDSFVPPPPGPLTPGGHIGRTQPLRRPNHSPESAHREQRNMDDSNTQYENPEAQATLRREVYGPHDALELLYKAATNNEHKRIKTDNTQQSPINGPDIKHIRGASLSRTQSQGQRPPMAPPEGRSEPRIDPTLSSMDGSTAHRVEDAGYKNALKAWARFRFVRGGWFTPSEAIDYIDYYYQYLSPLTPISPPTFQNPSSHPTLLMEEPILTVTLLTIASRYRKMPGPGGHCRSHAIHEQLWTYLRGMIERCLWGQEAFGGGFCGSGASEFDQTSSTAPWRGLRKGSLRTLGTVESLMILTEWHPRALHFPPAEATDELMLPSYEQPDNYSTDEDGNQKLPGGVGGKRIESWLEPAWRSDRMCWMLLSNAMGLSYELGVFDNIDELISPTGDMARPEYEDEAYRLRAARIKKLLLIYVSQLAGRLGWTNMVPSEYIKSDLTFEYRMRKSVDGNTPGTNTTTISNGFNYIPDLELDDQIIHCWAGITNAMRLGNEKLFKSRKHTTDIIQSGKYVEILKDFQPILTGWQHTFTSFRLPQYIKHILTIEYEYVRIYVNSLALQAVVERCSNNTGTVNGPGGTFVGNPADFSPETQNRYGMLPLARLGGFGPADQEYIKEVVQGSRNLLRTVVEGLLPDGYLKHAPVRTYFRIISGAMFLLKTFALGASRKDVDVSMGLMDKAVDALRNCVVDDVHLGIRFADLLETLTSRLKGRFMRSSEGTGTTQKRNDLGSIQSPQPGQEQPPGVERRNSGLNWGANTPNFQDPNIQDLNTGASGAPVYMSQPGFSPSAGTPFTGGPSNSIYDIDPSFGGADWSLPGSDMWYLPAGPAFFLNNDQAITQTAEGVNVAGLDLLDYMMGDLPGYDGNGAGMGNSNF